MVDRNSHQMPSFTRLIGVVVVTLLVIAFAQYRGSLQRQAEHTGVRAISSETAAKASHAPPTRFATTIRRPAGPPMIELQTPDAQGRVGKISCSTCHSVREPNFNNRVPADLDQFHQNMQLAHGKITCYSCHNPDKADTLRLADETVVEYPDVMTLCAQCHGTQMRDYEHGTHGGMTGYWDLSRGPRTRNNCIDCHDPHVPEFPSMQPTFKPRDRFLTPHSEDSHDQ